MKKRLVLLASITLGSFFFVIGASAQEKVQNGKKEVKAKTELNKQEIPKKCQECPSLAKCLGEDAKAAVAKKSGEGIKGESAACCEEKTAACCEEKTTACCEEKTAACCEGEAIAVKEKKKAMAAEKK